MSQTFEAPRPYRNGPGTQAESASASTTESQAILEAVVSPFHCLYQDALHFHNQSRLMIARSESESSRLARAGFLLYLSAAEALVHQAAVELGRPELAPLVADPSRPMPLAEVWRLLPTIATDPSPSDFDPRRAPWPQFAELLSLKAAWSYPGPAAQRRAYYRSAVNGRDFEPLQPHQVPEDLDLPNERLVYPKTGLPRDPYAMRPHHLDTARSVLDAAIDALDRRLGNALTADLRHRREPVRVLHQGGANGSVGASRPTSSARPSWSDPDSD